MFNIKEIWKATNTLVRYYGTPEEAKRQQSDSNGIERLSAIQVLYRELRILGVLPMFNRMRSTKEARDILWGRDFNTAKNQKKLLKKLSDKEWLQSLPPNTLGAHIGHMFNNFTIDELYEKRFNESEQQEELFADVIGVELEVLVGIGRETGRDTDGLGILVLTGILDLTGILGLLG